MPFGQCIRSVKPKRPEEGFVILTRSPGHISHRLQVRDPNELPELVQHLRLEATFQQGRTVHKLIRTRRGSKKHETWIRKKNIGHGGFGEVWLERKHSSAQDSMTARTLQSCAL